MGAKPNLSCPPIRGCSDEKRKLSPRWPVNPIQADMWKPAIAAIRLMILTEWRRGKVLGLRWSEVDLSRRTARLADTRPAHHFVRCRQQPVP